MDTGSNCMLAVPCYTVECRIIQSSGATRSRRCGCDAVRRLTSPAVLPAVSYRDVRHWQRWGAKLSGQRRLIPRDDSEAQADAVTASLTAVGSQDWVGGSTQVNRWNRRDVEQAKEAERLGPQGKGQVQGFRTFLAQTLPHRRRGGTFPTLGTPTERGKPVVVPRGSVSRKRPPMQQRVKEEGESDGHAVMAWRGVVSSPHAKAGRLPSGLSTREPFGEPPEEAKQMTAAPGRLLVRLPRQRVGPRSVSCRRVNIGWVHRVPHRAFERLERHAWKHARAVLRGGGGATSSP